MNNRYIPWLLFIVMGFSLWVVILGPLDFMFNSENEITEPTQVSVVTGTLTLTSTTVPTVTATQTLVPTLTPLPTATPTPRVFAPNDILDEFKTAEGLEYDWIARNMGAEQSLELYLCAEFPEGEFAVLYAIWNQGDICIGNQQLWNIGETRFIIFASRGFWHLTEYEQNYVHSVGDLNFFYLENSMARYQTETGGPLGDRMEGLSIEFLQCLLLLFESPEVYMILWEVSYTQLASLQSILDGITLGFSFEYAIAESCR